MSEQDDVLGIDAAAKAAEMEKVGSVIGRSSQDGIPSEASRGRILKS